MTKPEIITVYNVFLDIARGQIEEDRINQVYQYLPNVTPEATIINKIRAINRWCMFNYNEAIVNPDPMEELEDMTTIITNDQSYVGEQSSGKIVTPKVDKPKAKRGRKPTKK